MKLVIIFTIRLGKMLFINLFKIVKIVWTFGINAFVYSKKLAVFLGCKSIRAMRAEKLVINLKLLRIARR